METTEYVPVTSNLNINNSIDRILFSQHINPFYEAYSDNKYCFAVKKSSKISYKILLSSDSTFFKLFFHIFAAVIEALIVAGHKFLYALLIEGVRLRC